MKNELTELARRFESGNEMPVDRAMITRQEFENIQRQINPPESQQINAIDKIMSTRLLYMYDRSDAVDLYNDGIRAVIK